MKAEIYRRKTECGDGCCINIWYVYTVWDDTGKIIEDYSNQNWGFISRELAIESLTSEYPGITIVDDI
jgi:nuclear transport factor 2 (NTF2) superfamily protein